MEYLTLFKDVFSSLSGLGFFIGIIVLWKTGLLDYLLKLKKNGNGDYHKRFDELKAEVKEIKENHLHELKERLIALEVKVDILLEHHERN